jgi:predicted RNase H-like HicB family nuclease
MKQTTIRNIIWKEGKHFVALALNINVSSFGSTKSEALDNLKEAVALYFEDEPKIKVKKVEKPEIVDFRMKYA